MISQFYYLIISQVQITLSHIFLYVTLNTKCFMKQVIKISHTRYYSLIIVSLNVLILVHGENLILKITIYNSNRGP